MSFGSLAITATRGHEAVDNDKGSRKNGEIIAFREDNERSHSKYKSPPTNNM
jgi:hypothetical protein